ncbi:MAG: methyltransferase domain-containing protein [SAR324 cluster bacterium]|uniref:Methyltransferase domain-containing protein n=1 Tax=SAR324 cluster bacterium TaxID=2024889 RepID=A0A7X9FQ78_9DELT|nr:methyltransferase domain-containing protein [SAR324 cluster bacterium]
MHQIDFPDCTFDCCRIMTTFQHVTDPKKALDEIFRIVKIGGRIVAWEPNRRSFVLSSSFPECADKLLKNWANGILNPDMGLQLQELFERKNANNIKVHIIPRISHTLSENVVPVVIFPVTAYTFCN